MMLGGKYVDPPNPFASRVHYKADEEKEPIPVAAPTVSEPAMTNATTARAPVVPQKKRYQKRRLPGERLLRRVSRITPKKSVQAEGEDSGLDDKTLVNLHGAIGDIVERMRI